MAKLPRLKHARLARSRANRRLCLGRTCGLGKSDCLFHAAIDVRAALFVHRSCTRYRATGARRTGPVHSLHSLYDRALVRMGRGRLLRYLSDLLHRVVSLRRHCDCAPHSSFLSLVFAPFLTAIRAGLGCVGKNSSSSLTPSRATCANGRSRTAHYAKSGNELAARITESASALGAP